MLTAVVSRSEAPRSTDCQHSQAQVWQRSVAVRDLIPSLPLNPSDPRSNPLLGTQSLTSEDLVQRMPLFSRHNAPHSVDATVGHPLWLSLQAAEVICAKPRCPSCHPHDTGWQELNEVMHGSHAGYQLLGCFLPALKSS